MHAGAKAWLIDALSAGQPVTIPWQTIGAFVRISTHRRITSSPLTGGQPGLVQGWLTLSSVGIPAQKSKPPQYTGASNAIRPISGNLVPDGQLAALAIEYGLILHSTDSDSNASRV